MIKRFLSLSVLIAILWGCSSVGDTSEEDQKVAYKVEHYQQNVNDNEYTIVETEDKSGIPGEDTSAVAKNYSGFSVQPIEQKKIAPEGNTVIKIYYDRNEITLTFDTDGGSEIESITGKYGTAINVAEPTKTDYKFVEGQPKLPSTFPAKNTVYTATWAKEIAITFDANSGSGTMDVQIVEENSYHCLNTNTFVAPDGYALSHWNTEADGSGTSYYLNEYYSFYQDITLYAQWEECENNFGVYLPDDAVFVIYQEANGKIVTFNSSCWYAESFVWYIDGVKQSSTAREMTVDTSAMKVGNYTVMLKIKYAGKYWSETAVLNVQK